MSTNVIVISGCRGVGGPLHSAATAAGPGKFGDGIFIAISGGIAKFWLGCVSLKSVGGSVLSVLRKAGYVMCSLLL